MKYKFYNHLMLRVTGIVIYGKKHLRDPVNEHIFA